MFKIIKQYARRYLMPFVLAHIFFSAISPLLHAHSAPPFSSSHPEQVHVHFETLTDRTSICPVSGIELPIFTVEASESRLLDDVTNYSGEPTVTKAYPFSYVDHSYRQSFAYTPRAVSDAASASETAAPFTRCVTPRAP